MKRIAKNTCISLLFALTMYLPPKLQAQATTGNVRIEEGFDPIAPSYQRSDLENRLQKYDFLSDFNTEALTIKGFKITEFLDTNHLDTTANPVFVFHDWRFLNAALYLDQRLVELEDMYDKKMGQVEAVLKEYNAMLDSAYTINKSIEKSQKDTSKTTQTAQLQLQQKALMGRIDNGNKRQKAAAAVDSVGIQIVELFPIIELQLKELDGTNYTYSPEERQIIKDDYAIAKNIFSRIYLLYKKSFRGSVTAGKLFQLPGIPGWTLYHQQYNDIEGIYPDSDVPIIVVRHQ